MSALILSIWVILPVNIALITLQDLCQHKIKNHLVVSLLTMGFLLSILGPADYKEIGSLAEYFLAVILGLLIFLPLYVLKVTSAGDVKYFAALSGILGLSNIIPFFVMTMLSGSLCAFCILFARKEFFQSIGRWYSVAYHLVASRSFVYEPPAKTDAANGMFPYAIAISSGAVIAALNNPPDSLSCVLRNLY